MLNRLAGYREASHLLALTAAAARTTTGRGGSGGLGAGLGKVGTETEQPDHLHVNVLLVGDRSVHVEKVGPLHKKLEVSADNPEERLLLVLPGPMEPSNVAVREANEDKVVELVATITAGSNTSECSEHDDGHRLPFLHGLTRMISPPASDEVWEAAGQIPITTQHRQELEEVAGRGETVQTQMVEKTAQQTLATSFPNEERTIEVHHKIHQSEQHEGVAGPIRSVAEAIARSAEFAHDRAIFLGFRHD